MSRDLAMFLLTAALLGAVIIAGTFAAAWLGVAPSEWVK